MKKKLLILLCSLLLSVSLVGCDNTDDPDKEVSIFGPIEYVNTTESYEVNSRNGYKAVDITKDYDEETGEYTVVLKFKKVMGD